jgi:hypothetical protein
MLFKSEMLLLFLRGGGLTYHHFSKSINKRLVARQARHINTVPPKYAAIDVKMLINIETTFGWSFWFILKEDNVPTNGKLITHKSRSINECIYNLNTYNQVMDGGVQWVLV